MQFTRMTIVPDGSDFDITVHYNTSFMTQVFSLLFGGKAIRSAILEEFSEMGNVSVTGIDTRNNTARLIARDQSTLASGWYTYDKGATLARPVQRLEIRGSTIGKPIVVSNAEAVPTFFYQ